MLIVHISRDYPDGLDANKPRVVRNLVDLASDRFDHLVYSLNRISPRADRLFAAALAHPFKPQLSTEALIREESVVALRYEAPPKGLWLKTLMERVGDAIADDIEKQSIRPQLIHGHKLTVEGIVAARIAERLNVPFALSLQGNTDQSILSARPDLASTFSSIFHRAAVVFPFSPWILDFTEARLGPREGPTCLLRCPTSADRIIPPRLVDPHLLTLFRFDQRRIKNPEVLIRASRRVEREVSGYRLTIAGSGPEEDKSQLRKQIEKAHVSSVQLDAPIPHEMVQSRMNGYAGVVMLSRRESFGLVFIEALLGGCPVVYPRGRAIDGYFDGSPFAIAVPPDDDDAAAEAMIHLLRNQASLKAALAEWQLTPAASAFQRREIARVYGDGLALAAAASS